MGMTRCKQDDMAIHCDASGAARQVDAQRIADLRAADLTTAAAKLERAIKRDKANIAIRRWWNDYNETDPDRPVAAATVDLALQQAGQ